MSNSIERAFPFATEQTMRGHCGTKEGEMGMSLRDYFAAKAMAAVLNGLITRDDGPTCSKELYTLAMRSYEMADAMLAEREKGVK